MVEEQEFKNPSEQIAANKLEDKGNKIEVSEKFLKFQKIKETQE